MQKRRFLRKILTIFFLSTTVAAIQQQVLHAQIPGQEVARIVSGQAAHYFASAWSWQIFLRLILYRYNPDIIREPGPAALIRCFYPPNVHQVALSVVADARFGLLRYFTNNNLGDVRVGPIGGSAAFGPMGWVISVISSLRKINKQYVVATGQSLRNTDIFDKSPMAQLLLEKASTILMTAIFFGATHYVGSHMSGTWQSALQKFAQQNSKYPKATEAPTDVCMICREDEDTFVVPCPNGHAVHDECMRSWVKINHTCPTCRNKNLITELPPLASVQMRRALYTNEAVCNALSKTVRVYGPTAAGLLLVLFMHRRTLVKLDTIKAMWEKP